MARVEARRLLHVCCCCSDADATARILEAGVGLHPTMRTNRGPSDGTQLGIAGDIVCDVIFSYDTRGPRISPAVEIQGWRDPPSVGAPYARPNAVGIQSIGVSVPSVQPAVERLQQLGWSLVGGLAGLVDAPAMALRDPSGVGVDLVEDGQLVEAVRLSHLRLSCRNLSASLEWYRTIGFTVSEARREVRWSAPAVGLSSDGCIEVSHLRLPDEPLRLILTQWRRPAPEGVAYDRANHRGLYRFAVAVDDTRRTYRTLCGAGWTFTDPPRLTMLSGTPLPEMWIAFARDPDGIPVEFVQRPRSAFR